MLPADADVAALRHAVAANRHCTAVDVVLHAPGDLVLSPADDACSVSEALPDGLVSVVSSGGGGGGGGGGSAAAAPVAASPPAAQAAAVAAPQPVLSGPPPSDIISFTVKDLRGRKVPLQGWPITRTMMEVREAARRANQVTTHSHTGD